MKGKMFRRTTGDIGDSAAAADSVDSGDACVTVVSVMPALSTTGVKSVMASGPGATDEKLLMLAARLRDKLKSLFACGGAAKLPMV